MQLTIDSNVSDFLKNSTPKLANDATVHSFILSLASRYEKNGNPTSLLVRGLDTKGNLVIAGIQTEPDRALIISKGTHDEAGLFANLLAKQVESLPGVNGPAPAVDSFASSWHEVSSCSSEIRSNLRLFKLTAVKPPKEPPGFFRAAKTEDEDQIFQWLREFHQEAVPDDPKRTDEELYQSIREATQKEHFFVWEDQGECVCLVGSRRETTFERWVAPVYTPPHLRGRGYASALVAAVSQKIIESGKKGMLFTDLANPTSNSIYQKVGYSPVADFKHYFFS